MIMASNWLKDTMKINVAVWAFIWRAHTLCFVLKTWREAVFLLQLSQIKHRRLFSAVTYSTYCSDLWGFGQNLLPRGVNLCLAASSFPLFFCSPPREQHFEEEVRQRSNVNQQTLRALRRSACQSVSVLCWWRKYWSSPQHDEVKQIQSCSSDWNANVA